MRSAALYFALGLIVVSGGLTRSAYANLVANGDFGNIGNVWVNNTGVSADDWQTSGATAIPDWTNVTGYANEAWFATPDKFGLTNSPGNSSGYFVDLTGNNNAKPYGGLQQAITTTPGASYLLTFDQGGSTAYGQSSLTASATGAVLDASQVFTLTPTSKNQWVTNSLRFTADSTSTTIEFLGNSGIDSPYVGLDNVSVISAASASSSVPEPTSLLLLGSGLIGLGAIRRRKRATV